MERDSFHAKLIRASLLEAHKNRKHQLIRAASPVGYHPSLLVLLCRAHVQHAGKRDLLKLGGGVSSGSSHNNTPGSVFCARSRDSRLHDLP